jgi:hypothetical protein
MGAVTGIGTPTLNLSDEGFDPIEVELRSDGTLWARHQIAGEWQRISGLLSGVPSTSPLAEAMVRIKTLTDPGLEPWDTDKRKQLLAMRDRSSSAWEIAAAALNDYEELIKECSPSHKSESSPW